MRQTILPRRRSRLGSSDQMVWAATYGNKGYDHGLKPTIPDPELREIAYSVVSGAIEPCKNHLLLLNVLSARILLHWTFTLYSLPGLPAHIGFVSQFGPRPSDPHQRNLFFNTEPVRDLAVQVREPQERRWRCRNSFGPRVHGIRGSLRGQNRLWTG